MSDTIATLILSAAAPPPVICVPCIPDDFTGPNEAGRFFFPFDPSAQAVIPNEAGRLFPALRSREGSVCGSLSKWSKTRFRRRL